MADLITFQGAEVDFKSPRNSTDEWTVVDYTLPAHRFGAPLHYHEDLVESFYVLSGELWIRVGDEERNAGPGDFVLVNPMTLHSFANRTDQPVHFLAHASSPEHKTFLCKLFEMANAEGEWPPRDPKPFVDLGKQYDTIYAAA